MDNTQDGQPQTATEEIVELHSAKILLPSTVCRLWSLCLFLVVVSVGLSADLFSKHWVFQALGMPGEYKFDTEPELRGVHWIWQDVFGLQTSLNSGALFGFLAGQTMILVVFSAVFLTGIVLFLIFWAWRSPLFAVILGMITAGICGNLFDRLGWHGLVYPEWHPMAGEPMYAVRDWILCMISTFPWPNLNIADSLLVGSVFLLLLYWLLWEKAEVGK